MPRRANVSIENNFTRGYVTEATGLNFPRNAASATENCVFDKNGNVERRLGFEYELNYSTQTVDRTASVIKTHLWKDVTGDGTLTFVVVQEGNSLRYYNVSAGGSVSGNALADTTDLTTFEPSGAEPSESNECEFAEGLGKLFVVHPNLEPFYVTYNSSTQLFTETQITVEERDFEKLSTANNGGTRPTSTWAAAAADLRYDILNQGWYFEQATYLHTAGTSWDGVRTDLPSDSDVWWFYKDSSDDFQTSLIPKRQQGNTRAPRGHYVLNVFDKDRDTASGESGVTSSSTGTARFTINAFFAGRVWYAGLQSGKNSSRIFFSQVIETDEQIGRCYQANDPTSESNFDLLDNDGGAIQIPDAGYILKLWPLKSALLVFTTNGIWSISGSANLFGVGGGFKATDFIVSKLSSIPSLSAASFVDIQGLPTFWNADGIYVVSQNQEEKIQVIDITENSIKNFFLNVPLSAKQKARGAYNNIEKKVHWLYKSTEDTQRPSGFDFDRVLTYNTQTQSFSPWTLDDSTNVQLNDVVVIEVPTTPFEANNVVDDLGNNVVDNLTDLNQVVVFTPGQEIQAPVFKYLCSYPDSGSWETTFAETRDVTYRDWVTQNSGTNGIDFSSFIETAYYIDGDTQRFVQPTYVYFFVEPATNASALAQGKFDFSSNEASNKETTRQQIYPSSTSNKSTLIRRLKFRGKGRAFHMRIESESTSPFNIVGWSLYSTQNAGV